MTDKRTPDEIEHDLERNRAELQNTIRSLESTFTPDALFRSLTDNLSRHGSDFGKSTVDAARANPLALGVTAVGLGWLMFGKGPSADRIADTATRASEKVSSKGEHDPRYGNPTDPSFTPPRGPVPAGEVSPPSQGLSASQKARAKWYRTENYLHHSAQSASDRAGAAKDGAARAGERVRDRSKEVAAQLSEGTDRLNAEARERVIAARERAILAGESLRRAGGHVNRRARDGADKAVDFFEENPLIVGALALAAGALTASAMPRTKFEDEHFGEYSDRLYDEAEAVYHEERAKAERVAGAALDEARTVGEELRRDADEASRKMKDAADRKTPGEGSAADAAADRVEDAVERVAEAARDKAKKEDFGPRS